MRRRPPTAARRCRTIPIRDGVPASSPSAGHGPDTVARILTFTSAPLEADPRSRGADQARSGCGLEQHRYRFHREAVGRVSTGRGRAGKRSRASRAVSKGWDGGVAPRAQHAAVERICTLVRAHQGRAARAGQGLHLRSACHADGQFFKKGSRIRLELANGDSAITDFVFEHVDLPNKIGKDTIFHSAAQPSRLLLPVVSSQRAEK